MDFLIGAAVATVPCYLCLIVLTRNLARKEKECRESDAKYQALLFEVAEHVRMGQRQAVGFPDQEAS